MKRAEIPEPLAPMVVKTYDEIPKPPPGGVVIKTKFCGICHSDVHMADNEFDLGGDVKLKCSDNPGFNFPAVFGHEISGEVHSMDPNSENRDGLKVGDKVIVYPWTGCDDCSFCAVGDQNMCSKSQGIGCGIDGGFSEYVPVKWRDFVLKLPDEIPMDMACMLPCSGLTGYNAISKLKPTVERFLKVTGQATLLIVGAGGLGLWCLQTARASLPQGTKIIIADINQEKLENATKHGADDTVLWDSSLGEAELINLTKSRSQGGEINAIIDFVNSSVTSTRALSCLTKGGAMAMVGLFGGSMSISLPLFSFSLQQLFGIYVGNLQQLKELVELVSTTKLMPPEMSHVSLDDIPEVLDKLRRGEVRGRAIVKF